MEDRNGDKVLLITGDGGESYETLYALHRLAEAGLEPVLAAPSRKRLHLVQHDFEPGWDTYIERPGYGAEATLAIDEADPADHAAILILGGRAPEHLRNHRGLLALVRRFHEEEKGVFAICHGIQVLISAGLARGATLTAYEPLRFEVEAGGGTYSTCQAVRDGNIITGQTWQSHPEFYREIFAWLRTKSP